MMRPVRVLVLYAESAFNRTLSYQRGWPRHIVRHPRFRCVAINVLDRRLLYRLRNELLTRCGCFEAIVLLHSIFSNTCFLKGRLFDLICAARQPKVYFIGNEYKLMPEKMAFCDSLGVALLVSQTSSPRVHALYRERLKCAVIGLPNSGLDPERFAPQVPLAARPVDIGYRAYAGEPYLGHDERTRIAEAFLAHGPRYNLRLDISLDPAQRMDETGWAAFLNRCRAQLGVESGTDYFELSDETRRKVNAYVAQHPQARMAEIHERFFAGYPDPIPLRSISGRHIEAAGTKTVQILFEGHYDGYLQPDVHYIPLRKDLSNIDDVMQKFHDHAYCQQLVERAYALVREHLTYQKLLDRFHQALLTVL
jgi:hypothetical protein